VVHWRAGRGETAWDYARQKPFEVDVWWRSPSTRLLISEIGDEGPRLMTRLLLTDIAASGRKWLGGAWESSPASTYGCRAGSVGEAMLARLRQRLPGGTCSSTTARGRTRESLDMTRRLHPPISRAMSLLGVARQHTP